MRLTLCGWGKPGREPDVSQDELREGAVVDIRQRFQEHGRAAIAEEAVVQIEGEMIALWWD